MDVLRWYRELVRGRDTKRARVRRAKDIRVMQRDRSPGTRAFYGDAVSAERPKGDRLSFGTVPRGESTSWVSVPMSSLVGVMGHVTGATGSGKSAFLLSIISQLLRQDPMQTVVVLLDLKGELTNWVHEFLRARATQVRGAMRERFLQRVHVVSLFGRSGTLTPLNLLAKRPGVDPRAQADRIVTNFQSLLGSDGQIGQRMDGLLRHLALAGVHADLRLPELQHLLVDDALRVAVAETLPDPDLREWLILRLPQEPMASRLALLSRLERLSMSEPVRLALSAQSMVDFSELIDEPGIIVLDCSGARGAERSMVRPFGSLLVELLGEAVLSRRVFSGMPPVVAFLDEIHLLIRDSAAMLLMFEDLVSQGRWVKSSWWFCHQGASQLQAASPTFLRTLRQNVGLDVHFRCPDTASVRHLEALLPVSGRRRRVVHPWEEAPDRLLLTEAEERRALGRDWATLAKRHFWWRIANFPYGPRLLKSLDVDFDGLTRAGAAAPPDIARRCMEGTLGVPAHQLRNEADEHLGSLRARVARPRLTPFVPRPAQPETPVGPEVPDISPFPEIG